MSICCFSFSFNALVSTLSWSTSANFCPFNYLSIHLLFYSGCAKTAGTLLLILCSMPIETFNQHRHSSHFEILRSEKPALALTLPCWFEACFLLLSSPVPSLLLWSGCPGEPCYCRAISSQRVCRRTFPKQYLWLDAWKLDTWRTYGIQYWWTTSKHDGIKWNHVASVSSLPHQVFCTVCLLAHSSITGQCICVPVFCLSVCLSVYSLWLSFSRHYP